MVKRTYSPPECKPIILSMEATCCLAASGTERLTDSGNEYDYNDFVF